MEQKNSSNGSIGFVGLLTILFIALKLTHFINWSWWMVLSPIWIVIGIPIAIFLIGAMFIFISEVIDRMKK